MEAAAYGNGLWSVAADEGAGNVMREEVRPLKPGNKSLVCSIHFLRGMAALLVVVHHARNVKPWLYGGLNDTRFGYAGVVLFFIISGFIMYRIGRHEAARDFLRRRVIRVVPLYWIMTTFLFARLLLRDSATQANVGGYFQHYVLSLLFIPHDWQGSRFPMLVPGWTLNYEMFFYAIFAIGILLNRAALTCAVVIPVLIVAGFVIGPENALGFTYTNPILAYFLVGVLIGLAYERLSFERLRLLLPLGAAALLWVALRGGAEPSGLEAIASIVASTLIVVGALANEPIFAKVKMRLPYLLGDASYAIYLTHTFVLGSVTERLSTLLAPSPLQLVIHIALAIVVSTLVGVAAHFWLEKPVTRWLTGKSRRTVVAT